MLQIFYRIYKMNNKFPIAFTRQNPLKFTTNERGRVAWKHVNKVSFKGGVSRLNFQRRVENA